LLSRVLGSPPDFSNFLKLWSCFDGVPGHYELACNASALAPFNSEHILQLCASQSDLLQDAERKWIECALPLDGYELKADEVNDSALNRLLNLRVLVKSGKNIFIRDEVIRAASFASNQMPTVETRIQNLCGHGLESLTKSVVQGLLPLLKVQANPIPDVHLFTEVAVGYGIHDIDLVCSALNGTAVICFSCKVNPELHSVAFFDNINKYFKTTTPSTIYVVLCSPAAIPTSVFAPFTREVKSYNFSWKPYVGIVTADLSCLLPILAQPLMQKFHPKQPDGTWPFLERSEVCQTFQKFKHRVIHVKGLRRVGKTSLVRFLTKGVPYVDLKTI